MQAPAWRRASIAVHPESAPISRSHSEVSLHPPMRRRSMIQTPGVATRTRPNPSASKSTRASVRHSHPPTPNMSRQSSFDAREAAFLSLAPPRAALRVSEELPRVQTPKETDYSTTGAFKYGTLRITNGSPILTPIAAAACGHDAEKSKFTNGTLLSPVDYFAQGFSELDLARTTDQVLSQSAAQQPGKQMSASAPGTTTSIQQSPSSLEPVAVPAILENDSQSRLPVGWATSSGARTCGLAERCPTSPTLETRSRQAAVDDDLFEEDDDDQAEVAVAEVIDVRIDWSAKSFIPKSSDSPQISVRDVKRSDSGFTSDSKSTSSKACSSLAKADSGYSSNVSLRSLRSGRDVSKKDREAARHSTDSDRDAPGARGEGSQRVVDGQPSMLTMAEDDFAVAISSSGKPPTPPPKDDVTIKQVLTSNSGITQPGSERAIRVDKTPNKSVRHQPPAIDTSQVVEKRGIQSPDSVPPTPASVKSEESSSSLSIANSTQKPGRLQRLLSLRNPSSSKQQYTVHVTHAVDDKVPSIPKDVEDKLREHTGLFPMTTKRLALRSQMSKETLKTILSVGSLELTREDDLPRTPTFLDKESGDESPEADVATAADRSLKQTLSSMQSNLLYAAASMMPNKKPIVRKPVPARNGTHRRSLEVASKEDRVLPTEAELTSYSWINSSLGNNAYDAAATAMNPPRADRSMSLSMRHTAPSKSQPRRTYSLHSTPKRIVSPDFPPIPSTSKLHRPEKPTSSPPVSMATRGSFRMPVRRSPLRPDGSAARTEQSQNTARALSLGSSAAPSGLHLEQHAASGTQPRSPLAEGRHQQMKTGSIAARSNSLDLPRPSTTARRHSSISSLQGHCARESSAVHSSSREDTGALHTKQQSSHHRAGDKYLSAASIPHAPHQGPATSPPHRPDFSPWHWTPPNGSYPAENTVHPGHLTWVPPYVPRAHHRRNLSAGSQPHPDQASTNHAPYRILHSYNSPAYRNAPIWG